MTPDLATVRADVMRALEKFERDLGFTAPELWGMRVQLLREAIEDAFEPEQQP
jgi:hypothetical protein